MRLLVLATGSLLAGTVALTGCSSTADDSSDERFPDVVDATAEQGPDGLWTFEVTVSSPYDSPERYADAWRIVAPDGTVLGVRELTHHHAGEQPFTRSLRGVDVPASVTTVTVEGRDLLNGWGGGTRSLSLDR